MACCVMRYETSKGMFDRVSVMEVVLDSILLWACRKRLREGGRITDWS